MIRDAEGGYFVVHVKHGGIAPHAFTNDTWAERLRREQFRAVAIAYFVCSDQLFFCGSDVGTHKTTYGVYRRRRPIP